MDEESSGATLGLPLPMAQQVTELLLAWGDGDHSALDQLIPLVHAELRRIAARYMAHERPGHILQPTALVNEVYLKLVDVERVRWQNRAHFLAVAARLMRRVLVDSRPVAPLPASGAAASSTVAFDEAVVIDIGRGHDLLALDRRARRTERGWMRGRGQIVVMRFFAGLRHRGDRRR